MQESQSDANARLCFAAVLDLVLATIARDAPTKCRQRQMRHDLGKYVMGLLHRGQILRGDIASSAQIRSPTEIDTASKSLFYIVLQNVSLRPTCNVGTVVKKSNYPNRHLTRISHNYSPKSHFDHLTQLPHYTLVEAIHTKVYISLAG